MGNHILAINPGSTSTKIALFEGHKQVFVTTLRHSIEELSQYEKVSDQFEFRKQTILNALVENRIEIDLIEAELRGVWDVEGVKGGLSSVVDKGAGIHNTFPARAVGSEANIVILPSADPELFVESAYVVQALPGHHEAEAGEEPAEM